jgi:membrane protease YdiL (CAAX protease family)
MLVIALWATFAVCATAAVIARVKGRVRLGFGVRAPGLAREIIAGLAITAAAITAIFVVELATGSLRVDSAGLHADVLGRGAAVLLPWAMFEELLLRCGVLVGLLALTRSPWVAVAGSSLVFGLAHVAGGDATLLSAISNTMGGVMYAVAFVRTGRVWMPVALHFAWNFVQGPVFGFPVSGETELNGTSIIGGLVHVTENGPDWLTGGTYGPEGGVLSLAARALVITLVVIATRNTSDDRALLRRPVPAATA